jgi:hypothetical protein
MLQITCRLQQMMEMFLVVPQLLLALPEKLYVHVLKFFLGNRENFPLDIFLQFFNCVRV